MVINLIGTSIAKQEKRELLHLPKIDFSEEK